MVAEVLFSYKNLFTSCLLLLFGEVVVAQNAWHDAISLSEQLQFNVDQNQVLSVKPDSIDQESLFLVLEKYCPDHINKNGVWKTLNLGNCFRDNPYLNFDKLADTFGIQDTYHPGADTLTKSKYDVQNRLKSIYVDRYKKISDWQNNQGNFEGLFKQLDYEFKQSAIVAYLLPNTEKLLDEASQEKIFEYGDYTEALRPAFIKDLFAVPANLGNLATQTNFFQDEATRILFANAQKLASKVIQGETPLELINFLAFQATFNIDEVSRIDDQTQKELTQLNNRFQLLAFLLEALRSKEAQNTLVESQQVHALLNSNTFSSLFLALLYQNCKSSLEKEAFLPLFLEAINYSEARKSKFLMGMSKLSESVNKLNRKANTIQNIEDSKSYFNEFETSLQQWFDEVYGDVSYDNQSSEDINHKNLSSRKSFFKLFQQFYELEYQLKKNQFSRATFQVLELLEFTDENRLKIDRGQGYFITFIAELTEAKSSKEVNGVIKNFVTITGSSRLKRESLLSVSVSSYFGGSMAVENYLASENINSFRTNTIGLWFPIGLDVSLGLKNRGSLSVFFQLLDLGIATNYSWARNTDPLPKFTFENILSPGVSIIYGIPKSPFSISTGIQYGPQNRSIRDDHGNTYSASAFRINVAMAIDIPLINLGHVKRY